MKAYFLNIADIAKAKMSGGGNDPTMRVSSLAIANTTIDTGIGFDPNCGGGGHDPDKDCGPVVGGGGHDPGEGSNENPRPSSCILKIEGQLIEVTDPNLCKLQKLINLLGKCRLYGDNVCKAVIHQIDCLTFQIESEDYE